MLIFNRPKIGVAGPDKGGKIAWLFTAFTIYMTGGIPVRIRPAKPVSIERLNGLILGGGSDIDPNQYGEEHFFQDYMKGAIENKRRSLLSRAFSFLKRMSYPLLYFIRRKYSKKTHGLDLNRDKLEFDLLDKAVKSGMPVLGICRGAQLINVYFKGTLHQEIGPFYEEELNPVSVLPVKRVKLKQGSKLFNIVGSRKLKVNALHHQAIKDPGENIEIVAVEGNGIVQGIESTLYDFIIGVQWHPEYLFRKSRHRKIFKAIVEKARSCSLNKSLLYQQQ